MGFACRNYVATMSQLSQLCSTCPRTPFCSIQYSLGQGGNSRKGMSCLAHAVSTLSMNSSKFRQVDLSKGIDTTRCVMAQHVLQQKLQCKWNTWAPWEYECPSNTLNFRPAGSCSEFSSASCNVFGSPDFYFGKIAN